jgi:hypothetical protein
MKIIKFFHADKKLRIKIEQKARRQQPPEK